MENRNFSVMLIGIILVVAIAAILPHLRFVSSPATPRGPTPPSSVSSTGTTLLPNCNTSDLWASDPVPCRQADGTTFNPTQAQWEQHACETQDFAKCTTRTLSDWRIILTHVGPSVVKVTTYTSGDGSTIESGSGFFILGGYIITCDHVVAHARYYIDVWIPGASEPLHAHIVAEDPAQDLAALALDNGGDPGDLLLADVTARQATGEAVAIEGYPGGGPEWITSGNLTAMDATVGVINYGNLSPMLLLGLHAPQGYSGSPVVNSAGYVVGVVEDSSASGGGPTGAVPSTAVWQFLQSSGL